MAANRPEVIEVAYPFVRVKYSDHDTNLPPRDSWRPGTEEDIQPDEFDMDVDCGRWADAMGHLLLTVISTHRPAKEYPERVFYLRQFRDPDGHVFGKRGLRVTTRQAFNRLCAGYRHPYKLENDNGNVS